MSRFMQGLGERVGFAGIAVVTVVAAVVGGVAASCDPESGRPRPAAPTAAATCEEDQSWCWNCHTDGNRRCGPEDPAVQR